MASIEKKFIPREAEANPDISADKRGEKEESVDSPEEENFPSEFPFNISTKLINEGGGRQNRSKKKKLGEKQKEEF